ncbi:two-component system response regulator VicR [Pedobacter sp. UYP30]|uniref:response regulator n=1 Tax=Pedobacter sp. UYP30 TaxID=1756400 RepID=UPI003392AC1E
MKKKVILVQDNEEILEIMDEALEDEGFEVTALLAPKPIEEIEQIKPDAIVVDDHIKGKKRGSEVIKEVKDNKKTAKVAAVLTSTSGKLPEQAKLCDADDYIQKPFDLDEMISVVKRNT